MWYKRLWHFNGRNAGATTFASKAKEQRTEDCQQNLK